MGRIVRVYDPETKATRDGKVVEETEPRGVKVRFLHGRPLEQDVEIGELGELLHHNEEPVGQMRRAPKGFAHAMLCDQGDGDRCWLVIDAYGPMEMVAEDEVRDWVPVYLPDHGAWWREVYGDE